MQFYIAKAFLNELEIFLKTSFTLFVIILINFSITI